MINTSAASTNAFAGIHLNFGVEAVPTEIGSPPPPPANVPYSGTVTLSNSFLVGELEVDCGAICQDDADAIVNEDHAGTLTVTSSPTWTGFRKVKPSTAMVAQRRGKKIAGYGASPTVTTLMAEFGLAQKIECLFDDNPVKQNTFSPGQHVPVFASEAIYTQKPDVIAILAWNYATPIMTKHALFTQNGGRFLLPLPHLQVM